MLAMAQQSPLGMNDFRNIQVSPEAVARKLNMDDAADEDGDNVVSVKELLHQVSKLQESVRQLGKHDAIRYGEINSPPTSNDVSGMRHSFSDPRSMLHHHYSSPELRFDTPTKLRTGIYTANRRTSVASSPEKDDVASELRASFSTPPKRRDTVSTPGTAPQGPRVAALTRENISLLPAPFDFRRRNNYTGSIAGSQKSRTSVRTDGGAVFSRLYQPDFYKNRDAKLRAIRDRQESINFGFVPKINRQPSVSSRDSVGSSSMGSMQSAKTDVSNVSSRLYDPDYLRKRSARLQRMREEQELRNCTFAPSINMQQPAHRRSAPGASTPRR